MERVGVLAKYMPKSHPAGFTLRATGALALSIKSFVMVSPPLPLVYVAGGGHDRVSDVDIVAVAVVVCFDYTFGISQQYGLVGLVVHRERRHDAEHRAVSKVEVEPRSAGEADIRVR
jgi:hypothetical protein